MKYLFLLLTLIFASCSDQPEYIEMELDSNYIRPVDTVQAVKFDTVKIKNN